MRRFGLKIVLACVVILGLVTALVRYGPTTRTGQAMIVNLATGVRVGDLGWLKVAGLAGDPWSDFTLARLEIADPRGVWLSARDVRISWRPAELLGRRLRMTSLSAGSISLVRQPRLLASQAGAAGGGPSPVSIQIDRFNTRLIIDPAFALRRGDYDVDGALNLGRRNALSGRVSALSREHPGDFLRVGFTFNRKVIDLEAHAREATGGALAGSLGLEVDKPFLFDAQAHGSPKTGSFSVATTVGATAPATAAGHWSPSGGDASGHVELSASRLLSGWRDGIGPTVSFQLTATGLPKGLYSMAFDGRGANAALTARGEVDIDHRRTGPGGLALAASAGSLSSLTGFAGLGSAKATAHLAGDATTWSLIGAATLDSVKQVGFNLVRVEAPFQLSGDRSGVTLHSQAVAAADPMAGPLAALLGPTPRANAEMAWLTDGRVLWRKVSIHGAAVDVDGQGSQSLFGALSFAGKAQVRSLLGVAPGTEGSLAADWSASQTKATAPWVFRVHSVGKGLRLESAEANSLLGSAPDLRADGQAGNTGITLTRAVLKGAGGSATASGLVGAKGDLRVRLDWTTAGPLVVGPLAISGASQGSGEVTGAIDKPRLDLTVDFKTIDLPDLPALRLTNARVALSVLSDGQTVSGRVGLTGASARGPAKADVGFHLDPGQIGLSDIDVAAGGAIIKGGGVLRGGSLVEADLTGSVGPGVFIDQGHADGRVQITPSADGPRAHVAIKASGVTLPGGGGVLQTLALSADGPLRRLPYRLEAHGNASGLGGRLIGSGLVTEVKNTQVVSFTGAGRLGAADFRTLSPAQVSFGSAGLDAALHLSLADGKAEITLAQNGSRLSGHGVFSDINLAVLNPDIRGRGEGVLTVAGDGGALTGTVRASVSGVGERDLQGSAPVAGSLEATFGGGVVALKTQLGDSHGSRLSADLRLPATLSASPFQASLESRKPISGRFSADGQIGPLWDLIEGGGRSLTGHLVADGAIGGTLADPRLTGAASVTDGDFEDSGVGLKLRGLTLRADLHGESIDVTQFTATDGARGGVTGSGRVSLLRGGASGFRIALKGFRLIDNSLGQATASGTVNVDRAADGKVRLGGALAVDRAQISAKATAPSGVVPMAVTEIHRTTDVETFAPPPPDREPPVALDIALTSSGGIFLKGRGLNLEMSLDAKVSGSTANPSLTGVARLVRGDYDFAGKRFQVDDRSVVYLGSTPETIRLDLTATRDDPTLTAVIRIGGTAAAPTLTLSSTPALPPDEVLSQVLFGSSAAQLSGFQAAQLASAVAGLAGGGGFDVIGGLRGFAHLDRLAIDSGAATGFAVAGGKYLTDTVYLEVSGGGKNGQGAQVEWRVRKHLAIVSRVTSQGDHAVSIRWRKDY